MGLVLLGQDEALAVAQALGASLSEFLKVFTYQSIHGLALRRKRAGWCVFYDNGLCRVYAVRPAQCGSFPFWDRTVKSRRNWDRLARRCCGIGRGDTVSADAVKGLAARSPW